MHRFSLFAAQGWRDGDFPNAEAIGDATVSLPLFPSMSDGDVDRVCEALAVVLAGVLDASPREPAGAGTTAGAKGRA